MNEIKYAQNFCGWTQEQARMARPGWFFGAGIDTLARAIETLARGERHEPVSLLASRRVCLRKSPFPPAKRDRRLRSSREDQDEDAPRRFAGKSRLRPQPAQSVAHAHRLAVIDLDKTGGLSLRTFRPSSTTFFDQLMSYDTWSSDA